MYFLNRENIVQFIDPLMDWNGLEDNAAVLGKAVKIQKLHSTRFLFTALHFPLNQPTVPPCTVQIHHLSITAILLGQCSCDQAHLIYRKK